jgi:hypothetical protein
LADEGRADGDDPGKRPKRTHIRRKVVACLFRLNDHRNPEGQGENAAGEGDPVGKVSSSCHLSVVASLHLQVILANEEFEAKRRSRSSALG